ncbi:MAG: FAS1-like dehydratase domain-containing protein [Myxococcales bacterium]
MPIDPRFVGKSYGPYVYRVGLEKIREFAVATSTLPLPYELARQAPEALRPVYHDEAAGKASRHGSVIAPPTFCVNFAIAPFLRAVLDPELGINVAALLHGEQEFEFHRPVRPDDVITTSGKIEKIYEKAGKDFLVVETVSKDAKGELVVRGVWTAVIRQ